MILPSNLPANNMRTNMKQFAHVRPWRPDAQTAKQLICEREAAVVAQIQKNARDRMERRKVITQRVQAQTRNRH